MLRDAEHLRGVSLGRDAWRRLKKRRSAMLSLGFLITLTVLAILTPLLPFQPPRTIDLKSKYLPPLREWWYVPEIAEGASPDTRPLPASLPAIDVERLRPYVEDGAWKKKSVVYPEYAKLDAGFGYEDLDWVSQRLLETRIRWFGQGSFGSWCGTDNLGATCCRAFSGVLVCRWRPRSPRRSSRC
ncbi:MAG: hypothetical protein QM811_02485 [Pirellulales bacterium]